MYTTNNEYLTLETLEDSSPLTNNKKSLNRLAGKQISGYMKDSNSLFKQRKQEPYQNLDFDKNVSCCSIWLQNGKKLPESQTFPKKNKKRGPANKNVLVDEFIITNKVYMSFADPKLTEDVLKCYFSSLGKVTQLYLCNSFKEAQFVYGFVKFNSKKIATSLVEQQMTTINGSIVRFRPVIEKDPVKIAKILKNQDDKEKQKKKKVQEQSKHNRFNKKMQKLEDESYINQPIFKKRSVTNHFSTAQGDLYSPKNRDNVSAGVLSLDERVLDIRNELDLTLFSNKRLIREICDSHIVSDNVVFNLQEHRFDKNGNRLQPSSQHTTLARIDNRQFFLH